MAGRRITAGLPLLAALAFGALFPGAAAAGEERTAGPAAVRAGIFLSAPFVMTAEQGDGQYTGMAVELWEGATRNLDFATEYVVYDTWGGLLEAVMAGEVDVGVGAITVSHTRAEQMHFSFPWYDAGMRIMKKAKPSSFVSELVKSQRFRTYGLFGLLFLVLALLMTWFRRRKDPEFPPDLKSGYTLSLLDITSSVRCGEINQDYLGWKGNILSAIWMMFGMGMVAYVTSTMTTAMTTVRLDKEGIYGLGDLPGKKIAGLRGGMSAKYLRELNLDVTGSRNIEEAVERLREGKVQAVVSDAPVLEYWVHTHPDQELEVVGAVFHPDKYAFAAHPGQARNMDRVTVELIRMVEDGEVDRLKTKYLGDNHSGYLSF